MASNRSPLSVEALEDRLVLSTFPALNPLAGTAQRFTNALQAVGYYNPLPPIDGFGTNFFNRANDPGLAISGAGFAGFSSTTSNTGQTNPNLLGFGPADAGIPGMTATAGPADFSPTPTTTSGQTASPASSTATAQAQALAVAQIFVARLVLRSNCWPLRPHEVRR